MIPKYIRAGFWDNTRPAARLLNVFKDGSLDSHQLDKIAADDVLLKFNITPKKNHAYVHLITTGAMETYGGNNNGDAYNEDTKTIVLPEPKDSSVKTITLDGGLKKYHNDTYEKDGGVYREHNNSKKGFKPLGDIVKALYNDKMHRGEVIVALPLNEWSSDVEKISKGIPVYFSQGCFVAGSLVKTPHGYYPIETLEVGDEVISHTGKRVSISSCKKLGLKDAPMNTIKASGGFEATSTDYHQYFVVEKEDVQPGARYLENVDVLETGVWKEAKNVLLTDFVVTPCVNEEIATYRGGQRRVYGDFILAKVKKNTSSIETVSVYDIHVDDEDHSYIVNNMAVHNSSVSSDTCSICGNQAHTRDEYCDHIRFNLSGLGNSGHQVLMINDAPKFHDISQVKSPAEAICFGLRKVANMDKAGSLVDQYLYTKSLGDRLTEYDLSKYASKKIQTKLETLKKLAKMEKELPLESNGLIDSLSVAFKLSKEEVSKIVEKLKGNSLAEIFKIFKNKKMLLTPDIFHGILTRKSDTVPDKEAFKGAVKDIFGRILQSSSLEEILKDATYSSDTVSYFPNREIVKLAIDLEPLLSLNVEPMRYRMARSSSRGNVKESSLKKLNPYISKEANWLALEYGKYQLSFLDKCADDMLSTVIASKC